MFSVNDGVLLVVLLSHLHPFTICNAKELSNNTVIHVLLCMLDLMSATYKICDFGLSEQNRELIDTARVSHSSKGSQVVGTAFYKAPELFYNRETKTSVMSLPCHVCSISLNN